MKKGNLGVDIAKLAAEDVGMKVCYVPKHARTGCKCGWLNHPDTEWGVVTSWNEKFIHVRFGDQANSKACDPGDLFPDHLSNYSKRK